uniref:Uncharacterized protein n=1 Tax=viral metagenome TaxID=1070528 RepID=A0A6M3KWL1_9ZZZZ
MKKLTVQANVPEKKDAAGKITQIAVGPYSINVETGDNATEMVKLFGDEAVKSNADANWVVTLQSNMRAGMKKGETMAAMQARLGAAKMGVSAVGAKVDPVQAYLAMFQSATPEVQAKMLADLKSKAAK